jgi:DNA-binding FadR family transcriptional regulator
VARLHREIVDSLLQQISAGEPAAGARLPKEEDLAARFKVSRGTAREAIRALEERRVATVKHGRGATVLDAAEWDVVDPVVASALLQGRGRAKLAAEVVECLRITEPELVALAAERATESERHAVATAADGGEGGEGGEERLLHLVARAARNRPLASVVFDARRLVALAGEPADGGLPRGVGWAVATGAPDAARTLDVEHIDALGRRLVRRRR